MSTQGNLHLPYDNQSRRVVASISVLSVTLLARFHSRLVCWSSVVFINSVFSPHLKNTDDLVTALFSYSSTIGDHEGNQTVRKPSFLVLRFLRYYPMISLLP